MRELARPDRRVRSVTSLTNPTVKLLRSLHSGKGREETGLFLAEGARTATQALRRNIVPRVLAYRAEERDRRTVLELRDACLAAGGECLEVNGEILEKISRRDNPQAVICAYPILKRRPRDLDPSQVGVIVALDRVRDPGNLGTILRTADAAGADGVLLIGESCDPFSVEAVRASMGSIFSIPIYAGGEADFLRLAGGWPGPILGSSPAAAQSYRSVKLVRPALLVMGNEQTGLSSAVEGACTEMLRIPLAREVESLNLAVATGVLLFALAEPEDAAGDF
jgi:RNA methyltransferase, TrmH family